MVRIVDESGRPLTYEEIRQRLMRDKPAGDVRVLRIVDGTLEDVEKAIEKAIEEAVEVLRPQRRVVPTELAGPEYSFVIATPRSARPLVSAAERNSLEIAGVITEQYLRWPSVLYEHNPGFPLGVTTALFKFPDRLVAHMRFAAGPAAQAIRKAIDEGTVVGASIGYLPQDFEEISDRGVRIGWRITIAEMTEWSITPVPANPDARLLDRPKEAQQ